MFRPSVTGLVDKMIIDFTTYKAPKAEILGYIDYYRSMMAHYQDQIHECQNFINKYQNILNDRERMKKHRDKLNRLAGEYINKYGSTLCGDYIAQIRAEFNCNEKYAAEMADIIRRRVKKADNDNRNNAIVLLSDHMTYDEIGKKYGISRQAVHKIVKNNKKEYF